MDTYVHTADESRRLHCALLLKAAPHLGHLGYGGYSGSYEVAAAALGLLTATHADGRMAGPVTADYLSGVPTGCSEMLSMVAGMTALAAMLIQMRADENGLAPEETLAELGRRIRGAPPDSS